MKEDSGRGGVHDQKWARIWATSRPDYVHLRVFSWARSREQDGLYGRSTAEGRVKALDGMKKAVTGYFGEDAGSRIAADLEKARDEERLDDVGIMASRHVRAIAYAHSPLCRTAGRNSLDERLDMELSILGWCDTEMDGSLSFRSDSVLSDDWVACDTLIARLDDRLKTAFRPEVEKLRRGMARENPEAAPDSWDMGDVYDAEFSIASAVLSFLTEDEEDARRAHDDAAKRLSVLDLKAARDLVSASMDRMAGPCLRPLLQPGDVLPCADWDLLHAENRPKRLAAAFEEVLMGAHLDKDATGRLARQCTEIDALYQGGERNADCQITKLFAVLDMAGDADRAVKRLQDAGYIDGKDAGWLNGMDKVHMMRFSRGWKERDLCAFMDAAGGSAEARSVLVFQLSDDIASGRGNGYSAAYSGLMGRIREIEDGEGPVKERKVHTRNIGGREGGR